MFVIIEHFIRNSKTYNILGYCNNKIEAEKIIIHLNNISDDKKVYIYKKLKRIYYKKTNKRGQ